MSARAAAAIRSPGHGPSSGPPAEPPPPAPPGLWRGQAAPGAAAPANADPGTIEKQREISQTIGVQVQKMLEGARVDTETKVKVELKGIRERLVAMDSALDEMLAQLDAVEEPRSPGMDQDVISQNLSKLEQTWAQETRTLKDELHQTILAHNHNADLIKHHKDTIDELRNRVQRLQNGGAQRSTSELKVQCARLEALPKQQQMQKLEPLMERLAKLERQVQMRAAGAAAGKGAWPYGGMPPPFGMMPPGVHGRGLGMGSAGFMGAPGFLGAAGMAGGKGGKGGAGRSNAAAAAAAAVQQQVQAQAVAAAAHAQAQAHAAMAAFANPDPAALAAVLAGAAELGGDDGEGM